jgi:hypothetical protein
MRIILITTTGKETSRTGCRIIEPTVSTVITGQAPVMVRRLETVHPQRHPIVQEADLLPPHALRQHHPRGSPAGPLHQPVQLQQILPQVVAGVAEAIAAEEATVVAEDIVVAEDRAEAEEE